MLPADTYQFGAIKPMYLGAMGGFEWAIRSLYCNLVTIIVHTWRTIAREANEAFLVTTQIHRWTRSRCVSSATLKVRHTTSKVKEGELSK